MGGAPKVSASRSLKDEWATKMMMKVLLLCKIKSNIQVSKIFFIFLIRLIQKKTPTKEDYDKNICQIQKRNLSFGDLSVENLIVKIILKGIGRP